MLVARLVIVLTLLLGGVSAGVRAQEAGSDPDAPAVVPVDAPVDVPATPTPAASPTPRTASPAELAAQIRPAVVQVIAPDGSGTGVHVAAGVLTAAHVIGHASQADLVKATGPAS